MALLVAEKVSVIESAAAAAAVVAVGCGVDGGGACSESFILSFLGSEEEVGSITFTAKLASSIIESVMAIAMLEPAHPPLYPTTAPLLLLLPPTPPPPWLLLPLLPVLVPATSLPPMPLSANLWWPFATTPPLATPRLLNLCKVNF